MTTSTGLSGAWTGLWSSVRDWPRRYWNFWFADASTDFFVLGRIGLGVSMFVGYLLYAQYLDQMFGMDGLVSYTDGKEEFISRTHLWTVWTLLMVSAFCFAIGLGTKLAGIGIIACHLLIIEQTLRWNWGWVPTLPAFVAYYTLGPSHRKLSVDSWLMKKWWGIEPSDRGPGWAFRLLQTHVVAIYIGAGWHRMGHQAWIRGEMVYDAVVYAFFSRFPGVAWHHVKPVLELANWVVWGLELFAPLGLLYKPTRRWWALGLFGMHLGLELTSTIGWWQFMMMFALFAFFPESWATNTLNFIVAPRKTWARFVEQKARTGAS